MLGDRGAVLSKGGSLVHRRASVRAVFGEVDHGSTPEACGLCAGAETYLLKRTRHVVAVTSGRPRLETAKSSLTAHLSTIALSNSLANE